MSLRARFALAALLLLGQPARASETSLPKLPDAPRFAGPVALVIERAQLKAVAPRAQAKRLGANLEAVGRALFPDAVVVPELGAPAAAGLPTLVPRLVGNAFLHSDHRNPKHLRILVEWSLADADGCLVWLETVTGEGSEAWDGGWIRAQREALEGVALASHRAIAGSRDVQRFFARGAAPATDACSPALRRWAPPPEAKPVLVTGSASHARE